MDKTIIIGGGVALGLLILVAGSGKSKAAPAPSNDAITAVYTATAIRDQNAPAIIDAVSSANARSQQLANESKQIALAGQNLHDQQIMDFMSTQSGQGVRRQEQVFSFTGQNLADYRKNVTQHLGIASNEKIQLKKIAADKAVAMAQIDLQKQAQDNGFIQSMVGGFTQAANPGMSLIGGMGGGGGLGGGSSGMGGGAGLQGILGGILGGSSGSALSSTGGGVAGGGNGGGGSIISSLLPMVMALL